MTDTFEEHGDKPNGVKPIYRLKCVVVGDLGVGKTTLVRSFAEGPRTRSIAAEPKSMWQKEIKMASYIVSLSIWDTAGMDIFCTFEKVILVIIGNLFIICTLLYASKTLVVFFFYKYRFTVKYYFENKLVSLKRSTRLSLLNN